MNSCVRIKLLAWLGIAGVHFGLSNLILPLTMALTAQAAGTTDGPGSWPSLCWCAQRSCSIFPWSRWRSIPREWFPGNWVYVPMAVNSAIWACAVYYLIGLYRRLGRR